LILDSPLRRLLAPIDEGVTIPHPKLAAATAEWFVATDWRVLARAACNSGDSGEALATFMRGKAEVTARYDPGAGTLSLPFDLEEAATNLLVEAWRGASDQVSLSARQLDIFYRVKRFIPRSVQLAARRRLIQRQGAPEFPRWPLDSSFDRLLRLYALCLVRIGGTGELLFRWFWPGEHRAALILTHDVESAEGLRLGLELADIEEERGFRSSFNIVADWYPLDRGVLRELRRRGFEIGIHGIHHDRSMFATRAAFEAQLPQVRAAAADFEAVGFRSPATHRVVEWLPELPVDYDCTMPHSDPYEPQPGGCCSLWPFFLGPLVELPYTVPQDHTLLTLLRDRTVEPWLRQVNDIAGRFGLVQTVTHPDRGYLAEADNRAVYVELLDALRGRDELWHALPREVARWWRQRDAGEQLPWRQEFGRAYGATLDEFELDPPIG
jgi:peptidoglycan/xylan/chitin deacetylase (PgdA/CDA1 family)